MKLNNKAQSETVGFVIIILIVMILGVIFLGISLRQKGVVITTDAEIENFLLSSGKYTTDCYFDYEPNYHSLEDETGDCYSGRSCVDGRKACDVLNQTYSAMLKNFRPGGAPLSYYKLSFYYQQNVSKTLESDSRRFGSEIAYGTKAGCTSSRIGRNYISSSGGSIVEQLEICLAP